MLEEFPMKHAAALALALAAGPAAAVPLCTEMGFAGLLASCNRGEEIALTLGSGKPLFPGHLRGNNAFNLLSGVGVPSHCTLNLNLDRDIHHHRAIDELMLVCFKQQRCDE